MTEPQPINTLPGDFEDFIRKHMDDNLPPVNKPLTPKPDFSQLSAEEIRQLNLLWLEEIRKRNDGKIPVFRRASH